MVNKDDTIQLFDLSSSVQIKNKYKVGLNKILDESSFVLGSEVSSFEVNFSRFIGSKYSLGVNSGTDALEICLRNLEIGAGDEVIVPSFSFFATSEVVLKVGAQPIYCDINTTDLTMDISHLENLITNKTKAIIPVHLFGNAANLSMIKRFTIGNSIKIIEDVAQAFGSKQHSKYLGTIGHYGCFSFYPTKNLGGWGDGGLVSFQTKRHYDNLASLRNHGSKKSYFHEKVGLNSRLDSLQALILNIKLIEIAKDLKMRVRNNGNLSEGLNKDIYKIHSQPNQPMNVFPITLKNEGSTNKVKKLLKKNNISFGNYYPIGLHEFPISEFIQNKSEFKNTEIIKKTIITLPCHPKLNIAQIDKIVNILNTV